MERCETLFYSSFYSFLFDIFKTFFFFYLFYLFLCQLFHPFLTSILIRFVSALLYRMELGVAIWTSLVLLLLLVNDSLPSGHRLPILGMILILMLLLVSLSLVIVIMGTLWHGKSLADLPHWLQRIVKCLHKCPQGETVTDSVSKEDVSKCLDFLSNGLQITILLLCAGFIALYYFL